jgi:hypothetical protein
MACCISITAVIVAYAICYAHYVVYSAAVIRQGTSFSGTSNSFIAILHALNKITEYRY